ncbi:18381_t:CDS:1, partial [Acaulospora morrowiae]
SRCSAQGHGTNGNSNCGMLGSFRQGSGRGRRVSGRKSHSIGSMGNIGIGVDVGGMNGFGMGVGMIGDMTVGSVQQTSSMHGNRENYFKTEERLHNHEGHLQA